MDSRVRILRFGIFFAVLYGAVAVIYPFIPIYFHLRGFSPSRIGLLLGAVEISGILAPLLVSEPADRSGRFRTVLAALALLAALSVAVMDRLTSPAGILAASIALGFFLRPIPPLTDALTGRVLVDSAKNYGSVRVWGSFSFILLSLLLQVTQVLENGGPRRLAVAFILALAAVIITLPVVPPTVAHPRPSPTPGTAPVRTPIPPDFFVFLIFCFFGNLGFAAYRSFGSIYFSELFGLPAVSGLMALASISEIPAMLFGGRLLRRFGHQKIFAAALAAIVLRLAVLSAASSLLPIALSQLTHSLTYGIFLIAGVDWVNRRVPQDRRALGMSLFAGTAFGASILTSGIIGGFLVEYGGFSRLFGIAALFTVIPLLIISFRWFPADLQEHP